MTSYDFFVYCYTLYEISGVIQDTCQVRYLFKVFAYFLFLWVLASETTSNTPLLSFHSAPFPGHEALLQLLVVRVLEGAVEIHILLLLQAHVPDEDWVLLLLLLQPLHLQGWEVIDSLFQVGVVRGMAEVQLQLREIGLQLVKDLRIYQAESFCIKKTTIFLQPISIQPYGSIQPCLVRWYSSGSFSSHQHKRIIRKWNFIFYAQKEQFSLIWQLMGSS